MSERTKEPVVRKSRFRDRDQRMPTFHMLMNHDQHHHEYHFHHQDKHEQPQVHKANNHNNNNIKKRNKSPGEVGANFPNKHNNEENKLKANPKAERSSSPSPRPVKAANFNNPPPPPVAHNHNHKRGTSSESVNSTSSYRGPACNFSQFYVSSNNKSNQPSGQRAKVRGRQKVNRYSLEPEDAPVSNEEEEEEEEMEEEPREDEPADVVVWNPGKKTSRSNILCPITESERFNIVNVSIDKNSNKLRRSIESEKRARSNSLPHSPSPHSTSPQQHYQYPENNNKKHYGLGLTSSLLFHTGDIDVGEEELLDDFHPPLAREAISSVSLTSTYSLQIELVTQQLEQIQQAQNDILKQLGDDMSKVTLENEKLRKEIDHVREQNEGLLKVIQETTDELERMKQIFRMRSMPIPSPEKENSEEKSVSPHSPRHQQHHHHQRKEKDRPRSSTPPSGTHDSHHEREREHRHSRHRSRSRSRSRDGGSARNSRNSDKQPVPTSGQRPTSPRHSHDHHRGNGENPIELKAEHDDTIVPHQKKRSPQRRKVDDDSDNEEEKLQNGCYVGLNFMVNAEDEDTSLNANTIDPYARPDHRIRRRSRDRDNTRSFQNTRRGSLNTEPRRSKTKLNQQDQNGNNRREPETARRSVSTEGRGCFGRMFSCCLSSAANQKDYQDDMSILQEYRD